MNKLVTLVFIVFFSASVFGQEIKISERILAIAEDLSAEESDPGISEVFSEWLYDLSENPVRINSADETEIRRLFFLSDFQVKILADYIRTTGKIVSPFEIANIPGFDRESAGMMIAFITLENGNSGTQQSGRVHQTILTNLSHKSLQEEESDIGSPWKMLTKYKISKGNWSGGFTAEKDQGEKFVSGRIPQTDFLSGYIAYSGSGVIKKIIAGDYSARFGMGTNINTGIRTGLSLTTPGNISTRNDIRPYTSTDENNFFRGVAADLSIKRFGISTFFSSHNVDATLNDTDSAASLSVKNFYRTGIHNDQNSCLKKDAVRETGYGINLSYNFKNLRVGLAYSGSGFSLPVVPELTDPAECYEFTGRTNSLYTIYYNGMIKRLILSGEFTSSGRKNYALVQGLAFRPADRLNINMLYRNYSTGFVTFHGSAATGGSTVRNEYGVYANFTFEAAKYLFISAGTDVRYYPWLRYRCSAPSSAGRYEIRLRYLPTQKVSIEALYNSRLSMYDNKDENRIPGQDEIIIRTIRGSVRYAQSENLTLISRADYKYVYGDRSNGYLILQDIVLKLKKIPVSLWLRFGIFSTGGYDSGLYTWENDLLYSFSVPVLYGTGNRTYLMAAWKIKERAELRVKYGVTATSVLNERMKEISEFKIQFRITI